MVWKLHGTSHLERDCPAEGSGRMADPQSRRRHTTFRNSHSAISKAHWKALDAPLTRIWICSPTVGAVSLFLLTANKSTRGRMVIPCSTTTKTKISLSSHLSGTCAGTKSTSTGLNHSYLVLCQTKTCSSSSSPLIRSVLSAR